jgi:hypothetical protein
MYWVQKKELTGTGYRCRNCHVQGTGVGIGKTGYRSRNWHRRRRRERTVLSRVQVGPQEWNRQVHCAGLVQAGSP